MGKKKREHVVFDQMLTHKNSIPFSTVNRKGPKNRRERTAAILRQSYDSIYPAKKQ